MTINGTSIDQYLMQEVSTGFEYRKGDSGNTANGTYYQNILAKKVVLSLSFRPLTLTEYQLIKNLFKSTDEYEVVDNFSGNNQTINCFRTKDFIGKNVRDGFVKDITMELKEI